MKPNIIFLILFLASIAKLSFAQNKNVPDQDSLLAIQYYTIANDSSHNVPLCFKNNELAKPLLKKTKQWEKYVYILLTNNYCYKNLGLPEEQEKNNLLAIQEAEKLLGTNHYYYSVAINNLGDFYKSNKEDYTKAKELFQSALLPFKDNNDRISMLAKGGIYQNLGLVSKTEGDYNSAMILFTQSVEHFEKGFELSGRKDITAYFRIADVNKNIAEVLLSQNEHDKAISILKKYITDIKDFPNANRHLISLNSYLSKIHLEKGDLEEAAFCLNKSKSFNNISKGQQVNLLELEAQLSKAYKNCTKAIQRAEAALKLTSKTKKIKQSQLHLFIAEIYHNQKNHPLAIQHYQQSLSHLLIDSPPLSETQNPEANAKFRSTAAAVKVLLAKAQTLQQWYPTSKDEKHLSSALEAYQVTSKLTDQIRQNYRSEASKLFLSSKAADFYEAAIGVAKLLYELTKEEKHLETAFHFMEKSKAVLLLDELRQKELTEASLIPETFLSRANQFRIDINYNQKILDIEKKKEALNSEKTKATEATIFKLKEAQVFFKDSLQSLYPNYFSLTENPIISVADIRKKLLTNQQCLVEYFIGKNKIYIFKISAEGIDLIEKENNGDLKNHINTLLDHRKLDKKNSLSIFNTSAFYLYNQLIQPLNISSNQELIIIPDGILGYLPFEILISEIKEGALPKNMNFLIKSHLISYAYSATLLDLQNNTSADIIKSLGLFPIFENTERYLPHSETEIESLKSINAFILQGEQANVINFLEELSSSDLIHLSTHAVAEDSLLQQPAFYFRDSIFYLSDLYTLDLATHFVVMSACETGTGQERNGEGLMSLARGFTYAGVPSILTTLWKVNDKSSAEITSNFYQNLKSDVPKHVALRQAKLDYLQNCSDTKSSPYYWAGFIQLGNVAPLSFKQANNFTLWFGILAVFGLVLLTSRLAKPSFILKDKS